MPQLSIWEEESFYAPQDVVVVGAGFTGLWTALHLKEKFPNKKIMVMERGVVPQGASGRNAGFACFGSLTEIISDIQLMGVYKTLKLINLRFLGLKMIRQYFNDSIIDYTHCAGYELLNSEQPLAEMQHINELLYPVTNFTETFVQKDELIEVFGFGNTKHLIENPLEGSLHPGKLLRALSQLALSKGVQILYGLELTDFNETSDQVTLYTNRKINLKTEKLIFCTNAFTKKLFPGIDLTPARGQVLLTEPIPDLKIRGVFHYDTGFYYFRNLGNRILLGGARNSSFKTEYTIDDITTVPIQQELENFLRKVILPDQQPAITHRWAGIMGMGPDKFPIVKLLSERTCCAVRLSGMGVALAPVIGKKAGDLIYN